VEEMKGVKHYFKDGTEHKRGTHKDGKGKLMSNVTHSPTSKYLYHMNELSKTAQRKAKA